MQNDNNQNNSMQQQIPQQSSPSPVEGGVVSGDANSAPSITSYTNSEAPLLTSQADLRRHLWGGIPHRVELSLFENYITVFRVKDGETLLKAPLTSLRSVKKGTDFIAFRANGKRYQLEFALLAEKEKDYLLGELEGRFTQ